MMSNYKNTFHPRRRTRSVSSISYNTYWRSCLQVHQAQSDEMYSSSTSKDKDCPTYQSDSDDICSSQCAPYFPSPCTGLSNNMEYDSFNEISPYRHLVRRKRKFRRLAAGIDIPSNECFNVYSNNHSYYKRKRSLKHAEHCPGNSSRKRKRTREQMKNSVEKESLSLIPKILSLSKLSLEDSSNPMDISCSTDIQSSSSVYESSDSEVGLFSNDDGREGDDEQSDWVGETNLDNNSMEYDTYLCEESNNINDADEKRTLRFHDRNRDIEMRSCRRKNRLLKPNLNSFLSSNSKTSAVPSLVNDSSINLTEMDVSGSSNKKQTFIGLKKRKKVPIRGAGNDNVSDKSSDLIFPGVHKLSDISSSDDND